MMLLLAMASLSLVNLCMAGIAERHKVATAEGQMLTFHVGAAALYWCDVVDTPGELNTSLSLALLTLGMVRQPVIAQVSPPLRVHQPYVLSTVRHRLPPLLLPLLHGNGRRSQSEGSRCLRSYGVCA